MNVLLTLGHPRKVSLCAALCAAYREGACGGANVETLVLADLAFDPYVRVESPEQQPLEPGLEIARQLIEWVDHLVFVHPTCCGYEPALLKGFLERMVMPGFAFRFDAPDSASASGCGAAGPRKSSPPWTPAAAVSLVLPATRTQRAGACDARLLRGAQLAWTDSARSGCRHCRDAATGSSGPGRRHSRLHRPQ